jgi:hypothetical protein
MRFRCPAFKLGPYLIAICSTAYVTQSSADGAAAGVSATVIAPASAEEALPWPQQSPVLSSDGGSPLEGFISHVAGDLGIRIGRAGDLATARRSPGAARCGFSGDQAGGFIEGPVGTREAVVCSVILDGATVVAATLIIVETADFRPGLVRLTVNYN